jgi:lactoylglutathione lyase
MRMMHTMIRVRDLDASLKFYCELLDMKLLRKDDFPEGKFTLAFVGYGDVKDSTVLELTHNWEVKIMNMAMPTGTSPSAWTMYMRRATASAKWAATLCVKLGQ